MRPILLQGHTRPLTQIKYNKDGDLLFTVAKDNVANVWYSHNGERLGTYNGHQGSIWTIDVNDDCTLCITGSADNTARLWEVSTGKLLYTWEEKTAIKRAHFSEDGKMVLFVTERRMGYPGGVFIYQINTQEPSQQSAEPLYVFNPEGSKVTVASWGYLDRYIVCGHEDGSISLMNWKTGELDPKKSDHWGAITDIQFSDDKSYFISSSKDKTANLYESSTLNLLKTYSTDTPLNSASITTLQDFVVVGGGQEAMNVTTTSLRAGKFECRFYEKILAEEIGRVRGHFGPINTIAVRPDGKGFSSGGEDGYVRIHHFDEDYFNFEV